MANNKGRDYQDELDVYQAAWVIGKQRGEEAPLNKEQLKALLDAGRLESDWLGEEEKKLVGKGGVKKKKGEDLEKKVKKLAEFVNLVILGVFQREYDEVKKNSKESEWDEMSKEVRLRIASENFWFKHGIGLADFRDLVRGSFMASMEKKLMEEYGG